MILTSGVPSTFKILLPVPTDEIIIAAKLPAIYSNNDLGEEIIADPDHDSESEDASHQNPQCTSVCQTPKNNIENALTVSNNNNVDIIGPPHPPSNTAANNNSTVSSEVCNEVSIFTPTFEIELASNNSQDPLSVGVHSCLDGAAQSVCLFGGACSCANGASQPPLLPPGAILLLQRHLARFT